MVRPFPFLRMSCAPWRVPLWGVFTHLSFLVILCRLYRGSSPWRLVFHPSLKAPPPKRSRSRRGMLGRRPWRCVRSTSMRRKRRRSPALLTQSREEACLLPLIRRILLPLAQEEWRSWLRLEAHHTAVMPRPAPTSLPRRTYWATTLSRLRYPWSVACGPPTMGEARKKWCKWPHALRCPCCRRDTTWGKCPWGFPPLRREWRRM